MNIFKNQFTLKFRCQTVADEAGFSLIEILVSILLFSIISMNMLYGMVTSRQTAVRTQRNAIAAQIALEAVEGYGAVDPETLIALDGDTQSATREGVTYTSVTSVTIAADRTREVSVTTTADETSRGGTATIEGAYALWGKR